MTDTAVGAATSTEDAGAAVQRRFSAARGLAVLVLFATVAGGFGHTQPAPEPTGRLVLFLDDCTADQYAALPVIERAGGRVTFACPTGLIGRAGYMTAGEVADVARRGHEVASHSVTHPNMTTLSGPERARELDDSRDAIQAWTGVVPRVWVYPYGASNPATDVEARARYDRLFGHDRFLWTTATHSEFLRLLKDAGRTSGEVVAYVHVVDGSPRGISVDQLKSAIAIAARAGMRLVVATAGFC